MVKNTEIKTIRSLEQWQIDELSKKYAELPLLKALCEQHGIDYQIKDEGLTQCGYKK